MSLNTKWTRILSSFVIFSLLASLSVWDHTASASTTATVFSDVPAGHWAEKHVAKLALQGIVKGNNGLFKPNDNITQQEAVTLAIRFIGKENEVNTTEAVSRLPLKWGITLSLTLFSPLKKVCLIEIQSSSLPRRIQPRPGENKRLQGNGLRN